MEMDGVDSLNVARCILDHVQAVISLFSVVSLYHSDISISVYGPRVSTGEHSHLTVLHRLIRHVLGLLLKFRPSEFLHRGRRGFPTLWEYVLCLNLQDR